MKFLARFQRLERSRRAEAGTRHRTGERFQAIEPESPIPEVRGAGMERFAPPVAPPLELQQPSDAQPFVRCPACGVDSPIGARRCGCGTALDTLEAVAFNTALWDRHREELARDDAQRERRRTEDLEETRHLQNERRALGEALAREIAVREGASRSTFPAWGFVPLLGIVALVLLPRGPVARGVFAFLLGVVCVRAVVAWVRARSVGHDPGDGSSVDR